jgi:outer membrane protein assembly factor BamB
MWKRLSETRPQTAWSAPAKWDAWAANTGLQSLRNFDPAFFVTGQNGKVYFSSSIDNAVHCLDLKTGKEDWLFFTNAPVRFPPTISQNKLYFGSDDGFVYCINLKGELLWKYAAVNNGRTIPSNGKFISMWPCRTGVIVENGKAYFANSLVPWETSYICCVNAEDGSEIYKTEYSKATLEGAILSASDQLIIPQGRASALLFKQNTGQRNGSLGNAGSTFLLVSEDDMLISGPRNQKNKNDVVLMTNTKSKTNMVTLDGTDRMIIDKEKAFYHKNGQLHCINRINYSKHTMQRDKLIKEKNSFTAKKRKPTAEDLVRTKEIDKELVVINKNIQSTTLWKVDAETPISWIKAGDSLIGGSDNAVLIMDAHNGKLKQKLQVNGRAYGLAIIDQSLVVSTDAGHIYCFK